MGGKQVSKKRFRPHAPPGPSVAYPTWAEASDRREFLIALGAVAAAGVVGCVGDGPNRATPGLPDGGAGPPDMPPEGMLGNVDGPPTFKDLRPDHPSWMAGDLSHDIARPPDLPVPPNDSGGQPDQPLAPADLTPDKHPPWVAGDLLPPGDIPWPPPSPRPKP